MKHSVLKFAFILVLSPFVASAQVKQNSPELVVHLLDYLANDYAGAVQNGKIVSPSEYDEQIEFVQIVEANAKGTEKLNADGAFMGSIKSLGDSIRAKGSADEVAKLARRLQQEAIRLSGIEVAPTRWPDPSAAAPLYKTSCATCHGERGGGDGPAGVALDPKPANFLDPDLAWNSSPYKFYNTIRLGVPGTGMAAFSQLSDSEVWALAFYVKSLPHLGKGISVRAPDLPLKDVATMSDAEISDRLGGRSIETEGAIAALRTRAPDVNHDPIATAETLLQESFRAAAASNFDDAYKLAVRSYLEGIEPVEPKLQANAPNLVVDIETLMIDYRSSISRKETASEIETKKNAVAAKLQEIRGVFEKNKMTPAVAFGAAFSIFLREGFEAILILVILISVLRAMRQPEAVKWVHAGWILAVIVGIGAWFASGLLLAMSGMSRELMEGSISLVAVLVLIYVGFWLHRYSEVKKWTAFLEQKLKRGLSSGSYLGIALVSFMAVFREAFEVVLFLRAIWIDLDSPGQTIAGFGILAALAGLGILAFFVVRQSRKIPLGLLFQVCSWTMMALAVVLTGKGLRSLQEAGLFPATALPGFPRIDLLGIYPNVQTVGAQVVIALIFAILLVKERRQTRSAAH